MQTILPPSTIPELRLGKWVRSLFLNNEPGAWFDPSDFSTMFQDAAGTVPVTAVEQPVGLMLDKSKGLVLGPERSGGLATGTLNLAAFAADTGETLPADVKVLKFVVSVSAFTSGSLTIGVGAQSVTANRALTISSAGTFSAIYMIPASETVIQYRALGSGFVGTIDNISVRELPGNHAFQPTTTSRPVLSARYNLLTKTEQFDDGVWTNINNQYWPNYSVISANTGLAPDGSYTADALFDTAGQTGNCQRSNGLDVGNTYSLANPLTVSCYVKSISHRYFNLIAAQDPYSAGITVDLQTGSVTGSGGIVAGTGFVNSVGDGWYRVGFQISSASTGGTFIAGIKVGLRDNPDYTFTIGRYQVYQYAQQGTGVLVWGASLVSADQAHLPYQRVNTATDYDTAGFPHYLYFDGVDDWMVTNTITPGTDKVQVFAGVRKLRDAASAVVVETGGQPQTVNGFSVLAPTASTFAGASSPFANYYASVADGTGGVADYDVFNTQNVYPAPSTNTISAVFDRGAAPLSKTNLRVNGVVPTKVTGSFTGKAVTGNVLNTPLYIGSRAGTSAPFNGHIYSMIVRFGSNLPAATIENTEKYINGLTKAY